MLASGLQAIFFSSLVTAAMVALAMWLFYQRGRELVFALWALAFASGSLGYLVEALALQHPLAFWLAQSLSGERGALLLLGALALLANLSWRHVWLLLVAPLWVAAGQWLSWSVALIASVPALLSACGYLALAVCFFYRRAEHSQRLRWVLVMLAVGVTACVLAGFWQHPEDGLPRFAVSQVLHLLMAVTLLVVLVREQQNEASLALAGKEGAMRSVQLSRRRMTELNDWTGQLLRQVSDGIVICDELGRVSSFNSAAERIFGYDQSEVADSSLSRLMTPESWQMFFTTPDATMQLEGHYELEGLHRSGMVLSLDVSVSALYLGDRPQRMIILRDVSERKKQEARLNFFAEHDALTGLYNRHHFEMELNKLLDKDCQGWLVFLDLDDFKLINDALGHQAGDAALVAMSKRLLSALGESALVSRFSGDEFVIFVPADSDLGEDDLLEKLNQLLHQPVSSSGMEFMLSGSLGVVRVPEHGETVQALLRNADLAMYQAKRQGKNKFFLYTEKLQQELGRKADMATRLKSLVPDEQLSVFFQPRVGLPDRELCGAEALLRWRTPEGDFISPEQFIPVAEETGQILRIGYWVMEQACRWLSGWTIYHDPFVVSINLSPRQLFDERLVERIEALRLRYGLAAAQLEFEITESSAMQDPEYAIKVLLRLRALGYGLSLDDFGTGFSSLSQLRRLPVNVLKIDKSFVQNMVNDRHDRVMVAAIIELATHLELSVLAEGVETVDQLHLLDALGCNEVQGFLVSQPLPAEQFAEEVLINWNRYCRSLAW